MKITSKHFTPKARRELRNGFKHPIDRSGNVFNTGDGRRNRHGECVSWTPAQIAALNAQRS